MDNKVAVTLAKTFHQLGYATLRFNFRGVGASAGTFDGGEGEQDDFLVALAWMRKKHPDKPVIAGGFSFGAWVSSRAGCEVDYVRARGAQAEARGRAAGRRKAAGIAQEQVGRRSVASATRHEGPQPAQLAQSRSPMSVTRSSRVMRRAGIADSQ